MATEELCWEEKLQLVADTQRRMENMLSMILQSLQSVASSMKLETCVPQEAVPARSPRPSTQATDKGCLMLDGSIVRSQDLEERHAVRATLTPGTWLQSMHSFLPASQRPWPRKALSTSFCQEMSRLPGASNLSSGGRRSTEEAPPKNEDEETFIAPTLPIGWPTTLGLRPGVQAALPTHSNLRATPNPKAMQEAIRQVTPCSNHVTAGIGKKRSQDHRILRPGSPLHVVWCVVTFLTLMWDLTSIPVILAWDPDVGTIFLTMSTLSMLVWTSDMMLAFLTGVYISGELQTSLAVIAWRYIKTWFFFDVFLVLSDWMSVAMRLTAIESGSHDRSSKVLAFVKIGRLLRILRVTRFIRFIEKQMMGSSSVIIKTVCVLFGTFMLIHFICCSWFYVGRSAPTDTGLRWTDVFDGVDGFLDYTPLQQYIIAFHWAAAQLTLGGIDVNCTNSSERCFNVVCLLLGLLFGCSLVSSLSAAMVEVQMNHMEQHTKIQRLRKYLHGNAISAHTSRLVEYQMRERLKKLKDSFEADEPLLQNLLSSSLYNQLRVESFKACIASHPLLCLWEDAHPVTIQRLCKEAMDFLHLQPEDELCVAGQVVSQAYYLVDGQLKYTQNPDSSAVEKTLQENPSAGAWLCEAALWCDWVTVGTAVATKHCKLVVVRAEPLLEIMRGHHRIAILGAAYAESFHKLLVRSHPPASQFPTDLRTSFASFGEVVLMMNTEDQAAIGLTAMNRFRKSLPLSSWAAHALNRGPHDLNKLEKEIISNQSAVFLNQDGELERVVAVTAVNIKNLQGQSLVEIGKRKPGQSIRSTCQLPGTKALQGEQPVEALKTVLATKLPMLVANVQFLSVEQDNQEMVSQKFGVKTTYLRTEYHAQMADDLEAMDCRSCFMSSLPADAVRGERMLGMLRSCKLYRLDDKNQNAAFYSWIAPECFKQLQNAMNHECMSHWMNWVFTTGSGRKSSSSGSESSDSSLQI